MSYYRNINTDYGVLPQPSLGVIYNKYVICVSFYLSKIQIILN